MLPILGATLAQQLGEAAVGAQASWRTDCALLGHDGRFALRDGHNEAINWPNPRLVAWHTTPWVQRLQAKVYREWTPEWFCGRGYGDRIG